jgi:double-strand break repair protein MRE11
LKVENDTFRILLATDNHIGCNERDPIRGQDSINTFKEILQLAVRHDVSIHRAPLPLSAELTNAPILLMSRERNFQVDFILLAGDLFHENRPSRDCLYKTMALLREYTLGDKPVQMELLSDPDEGKADGFSCGLDPSRSGSFYSIVFRFPAINYEDPNFNVAIPVFSIHGNHDDPQGAGPVRATFSLAQITNSHLFLSGRCSLRTRRPVRFRSRQLHG